MVKPAPPTVCTDSSTGTTGRWGTTTTNGIAVAVRVRRGQQVAQRLERGPEAALRQVECLRQAGHGERVDLAVELEFGLGGAGGNG